MTEEIATLPSPRPSTPRDDRTQGALAPLAVAALRPTAPTKAIEKPPTMTTRIPRPTRIRTLNPEPMAHAARRGTSEAPAASPSPLPRETIHNGTYAAHG